MAMRNSDNKISSTSVNVHVESSSIKAIIMGGEKISVRADQMVSLDASVSYDNDQPISISGVAAGLSYSWTCHIESDYTKDCTSLLALPSDYTSSSIINFNVGSTSNNYIFDLVIYHVESNRKDTTAVKLTVLSSQYPSVQFLLANENKLRLETGLALEASARVSGHTEYFWSSTPNLIDNSFDSPRKYDIKVIKPIDLLIPLKLDAHVLYPDTLYTFTVTVSYIDVGFSSSASIQVITNGPPVLGVVDVNPSHGFEILDKFDFSATKWEDDDIPLTFSYGFYRRDNSKNVLQGKSEANSGEFIFPFGVGGQITYYCEIFDSFGLSTTKPGEIIVLSLDELDYSRRKLSNDNNTNVRLNLIHNFTINNVFDKNSSLLTSMEAKKKRGFAITIIGALNNVQCINYLNCTSNYNRSECANTPMTCGDCLNGYVGEIGDHNTKCFLPIDKELLQYEQRRCPGECNKEFGNGVCRFRDHFTNNVVDSCRIGEACDVTCACNTSWHGIACHISSDDLIVRSSLRSELLTRSIEIDNIFWGVSEIEDIEQRILSLKASLHRTDELSSTMSGTALNLIQEYSDQFYNGNMPANEYLDDMLLSLDHALVNIKNQSESWNNLMESIQKLAKASSHNLMATQYTKSKKFSTVSQISEKPSYYDPVTGYGRESGVNISVGDGINVHIPINNKTIDTSAAITLTSIKSDWLEDYYGLNRNSLATDMVRIDISDHVESIGEDCGNSGGGSNIMFRLPLKTATSLNAPSTPTKTYSTYCRRHEPRTLTYDCYNKTVSLICDGKSRYNTSITCQYRNTPKCTLPSELLLSNQSLISSTCDTVNFDEEYVTCSCNICLAGSDRRLQRGKIAGRSENLEVVAMVEYVVSDATEVLSEVDLLWDGDTYNQTIPITVFFACMWILFAVVVSQAEKASTSMNKKDKVSPFQGNSNDEDTNDNNDSEKDNNSVNDRIDATQIVLDYIQEIFPAVYSTKSNSTRERLFTEVKNEHLLMKMFTEENSQSRRIYHFQFLTLLNTTIGITAIIAGLEMNEDDGTCASHMSSDNCLQTKSMYDFDKYMCSWDDETQTCSRNEVETFTLVYIFASLAIAILISVPIRLTLEFMIEEYLLAPTVADVDSHDDDIIRKMSVVPLALRRMSNAVSPNINKVQKVRGKLIKSRGSTNGLNRTIKLPKSIKEKRSVALQYFNKYRHDYQSEQIIRNKNTGDVASSSDEEEEGVSETRDLETVRGSDTDEGSDYNSGDNFDGSGDEELGLTPLEIARRKKDKEKKKKMKVKKIIPKNYTNADNNNAEYYVQASKSFKALHKALTKHINDGIKMGLSPDSALINQWGLKVVIEEAGSDTSADEVHLNNRDKDKDVDIYFHSHDIWVNRIEEAIKNADKIIPALNSLPPSAAGAQLLRLFVIDMLGSDTVEAKIFGNKSGIFFNELHLVEPWKQTVCWIVLCLWNVWCFLLCILFGAVKGPEWQIHWVSLSLFTLFFLIVIDLSFEAAIVGFVVPSQILSSVRSVQVQLSQALVNHILPVENLIIKNDKNNLFSASNYLYTSYICAHHLKYLPESSLILSYVDPLPHVQFTSIFDELKKKVNQVSPNGNPTENRIVNKRRMRARLLSKIPMFSFASLLMWVGTFPIPFQRVLVSIPMPVIASMVGLLAGIVVNTNRTIWIPLSIIFVIGLLYFIYYFNSFMKSLRENLQQLFSRDDVTTKEIKGKCKIAAKHNVPFLKKIMNKASKGFNYNHNEEDDEDKLIDGPVIDPNLLEDELHNIRLNAALKFDARNKSMLRKADVQRSNLQKRLDKKIRTRALPKLSEDDDYKVRRSFRADHPLDDQDEDDDHLVTQIIHRRASRLQPLKRRQSVLDIEEAADEAEIKANLDMERRKAKAKERVRERLALKYGVNSRNYMEFIASSEEEDNTDDDEVQSQIVSNDKDDDDGEEDGLEDVNVKVVKRIKKGKTGSRFKMNKSRKAKRVKTRKKTRRKKKAVNSDTDSDEGGNELYDNSDDELIGEDSINPLFNDNSDLPVDEESVDPLGDDSVEPTENSVEISNKPKNKLKKKKTTRRKKKDS